VTAVRSAPSNFSVNLAGGVVRILLSLTANPFLFSGPPEFQWFFFFYAVPLYPSSSS